MERETRRTQGDWLLYLRKRAGWSHVQLADVANVSHDTISNIESGRDRATRGRGRGPTFATKKLITAALSVRFTELTQRDADGHRLSTAEAQELIADLQCFMQAPPGPAAARPPAVPTTLPAPLTSFVGRAEEIARAVRLLSRRTMRLLTLTGPGGVGKTRLALEIAAQALPSFPDGVYLVELAPLTDAEMVLPTIALALGLRDEGTQPVSDRLASHLRGKTLLLLLDNAEQVTAAAPALATLLEACGALSFLVTSRRPLHLLGERQMLVRPLAVPPSHDALTMDELAGIPSVDLFVQRAQDVRPESALTDETARAVAAICQRLEGIPLAIELAAAQSKIFSPAALLARLEQHVLPLASTERNRPTRHQTMRAAIAGSYDLLTADQRAFFAHLALFVGGCTLEAAAAVGGVREALSGDEALAMLTALVEASLLHVTPQTDGEPRFAMLETIRVYALEQLDATGEGQDVRTCYRDWYLALATEAEPQLTGPEQAHWLARLDAEQDNLRATLQWMHTQGQGPQGLQLAGALWAFWSRRGQLREGRRWLELFLAEEHSETPGDGGDTRAKALTGAGVLAIMQGDHVQGQLLCHEGLRLYRASGDQMGISVAVNVLAIAALDTGDYDQAALLHEESLAHRRARGDKGSIAVALNNVGNVARARGEYVRATELFSESLELRRVIGDTYGMASSLNNLGLVSSLQGDYAQAMAQQEESLTLLRALGDVGSAAWVLHHLGEAVCAQGSYERAQALLNLPRFCGHQKIW